MASESAERYCPDTGMKIATWDRLVNMAKSGVAHRIYNITAHVHQILEADAEIDRLKADNKRLKSKLTNEFIVHETSRKKTGEINQLRMEIERLKAENDRLKDQLKSSA